MNSEDLKGLKYYAIYCFVLVAFFVYSGVTGWKWFNPTPTEPAKPAGRHTPGQHIYRYHK